MWPGCKDAYRVKQNCLIALVDHGIQSPVNHWPSGVGREPMSDK